MNICQQKADASKYMTKWKTPLIQKDPLKQLQTHNLPTYDVENANCTNKGRDLRFAKKTQIVTRGIERISQRIHRYIDHHILKERKMKLKHFCMAWINYKNAYDMVPQVG